jgi:Tol biopolymer transport system component
MMTPAVRTRRFPWFGAITLIVVAGVVVAGMFARRWHEGGNATASTVVPFTSYRGVEGSPSFSPGGNEIAFAWNGPGEDNVDIYVKALGNAEPRRLTSAAEVDDVPAWSPDGRWIAFVRRAPSARRGDVYLISPTGGKERKLGGTSFADMKVGPTLAWTSDGKRVAIRHDSDEKPRGLYLLSVDTQDTQLLLESPPEQFGLDAGAAFSADGKKLAFTRNFAIYVADLDGLSMIGKPRQLTHPKAIFDFWPAWNGAQDEIIFVRRMGLGPSTLWRVSADGTSEPKPIPTTGSTFAFELAVPRKGGRLVYSERNYAGNIWKLPLTRDHLPAGPPVSIIASSRFDGTAAFSADAGSIAFTSNRSGSEQIWVARADGSHQTQLTHYPRGLFGSARWSPDSKFIVYDAWTGAGREIVVMSAEGGPPIPFANGSVPSWSADGKWIYFSSNMGGRREIWKKLFGGGEAVKVTTDEVVAGRESPDGRFFCYFTRDPETLWVMPMKDGVPDASRKRLASEKASSLVFDVSNTGVYFGGHRNSDLQNLPRFGPIHFYEFATGRTIKVFETEKQFSIGLSVSEDERSLIYSQVDDSRADLMLVEQFR